MVSVQVAVAVIVPNVVIVQSAANVANAPVNRPAAKARVEMNSVVKAADEMVVEMVAVMEVGTVARVVDPVAKIPSVPVVAAAMVPQQTRPGQRVQSPAPNSLQKQMPMVRVHNVAPPASARAIRISADAVPVPNQVMMSQ